MFGGGGANFSGVTFLQSGFAAGDAINGLSVKAGKAVLGNDIGEVGNPGQLTSNREIQMNTWQLSFIEPGNNFQCTLFAGQGWSIEANIAPGAGPAMALGAANFAGCVLDLASEIDSISGVPRFYIGDALSRLRFDALQSGQVWLSQIIDDPAPPYGFFAVRGDVWFSGTLRYRNNVSTQSSPFNITEEQSGEVFGDVGAAGPIDYNLPTITVTGDRFGFFVLDGQTVTVNCQPGEIVYIGSTFGVGFTDSTPGSFIWIVSVAPGVWMAESTPAGTWTLF